MMLVSGHKTQKTFRDYIKLSSEEIADKIAAIVNGAKEEVFWEAKYLHISENQNKSINFVYGNYCPYS